MTMNNTKTTGITTNNGGKVMTKAEILRKLKAEFPELEMAELKEMANEEWEAQFNKEEKMMEQVQKKMN